MRATAGRPSALTFTVGSRRKRVPSGIAAALAELPSVRWAGHTYAPALALGMARARAWSTCPACSSPMRMSPPRSGSPEPVAPTGAGR
jgi:hypothetical protein